VKTTISCTMGAILMGATVQAFAAQSSGLPLIAAAAEPASGSDAESAGSGSSSSQQAVLKPVIVTAQKYAQNEQAVPIAITALAGSQLAARGISDTESLFTNVAGVSYQEFGASPEGTLLYIRGVGNLDFGDQQESPNSLYIDGAYFSFQGAAGLPLYDMQQVSIARGPQGTLFGRNATGGLIQLTTNKPTDYFTGYLTTGYGSYNESKIEGAISGPLSNDVDVRVSFLYHRQDGFIDNTLGPNVGGDKSLNARFQVQYTPTAETKDLFETFINRILPDFAAGGYTEAYPSAPNPANHGLDQEDSGALFAANCANLYYTAPPGGFPPGTYNCLGETEPPGQLYPTGNPWRLDDPRVGFLDRWLIGATNTLTQNLSWAELTATTNYTYFAKHYIEDDSLGPVPLFGYGANTNAYQASQELRLSGSTPKLDWQAGLYFLTIDGEYNQTLPFGDINSPYIVSGAYYHQDVYSYALYNQYQYAIDSRWHVILGGRVEKDRKRADVLGFCSTDPAVCDEYGYDPTSQSVSGTLADTEWSGNFQLTYNATQDVMLYAGVRRGTKSGEIVVPLTTGPGLTFQSMVVKPEVLTDFEGGLKSELLGNRLRVNLNGFYYHYDDYQAFKFVVIEPVLFNAQARDFGADLDTTAALTSSLTAHFSLEYLHTRVFGVALPDGSVDNDAQQPLAPNLSFTSDLRKEWQGNLGRVFIEAGVSYVGARYFSTINEATFRAPSYVIANASAGYTTPNGKWTSALTVDNLNDEAYPNYIADNTLVAGYTEAQVAPPRMIHWQLTYNF
jgi:iron complex outermembrane recepter protein